MRPVTTISPVLLSPTLPVAGATAISARRSCRDEYGPDDASLSGQLWAAAHAKNTKRTQDLQSRRAPGARMTHLPLNPCQKLRNEPKVPNHGVPQAAGWRTAFLLVTGCRSTHTQK